MLTKRRPSRSSAQLPRLHNKLAASKSTEHFPHFPPKTSSFTFRINLKRNKPHPQTNSHPLILIVPDQQLSATLKQYPLRHTILSDQITTNQETAHQLVLSHIEQFSQYYGKVLKQMGRTECKVEWVLICKAVNSQQLQNELNRRYQTFNFVLLPSVVSAVNRINNYAQSYSMSCVGWEYWGRIVNWSSLEDGMDNANGGISEQAISNLPAYQVNQRQLWIISPSMVGHFKKRSLSYYFLDYYSIQSNKIKIKAQAEHTVYVIITGSSKIADLISSIPDSQQTLKRNLLSASPEYLLKVSSRLKDDIIHCLINFPKQLIDRFSQRPQYFTTASQTLQFNKLNLAYIHFGAAQQPDFKVIQFDPNAPQQQQMQRVLCFCQERRRIQLLYSSLKAKIAEYELAVLHIAGNQQLHSQLEYFLSTTITVIQQIRTVFELSSQRRVILLGKFSKIQTDSLRKLPHLTMLNLKHIDQPAQTKHHQLIKMIQQAIAPHTTLQTKTVTFIQQPTLNEQPKLSCINRMTCSQISPKMSWESNQTRCHSAPNLSQSSTQIYIAIPKTVPYHSLLNRSIVPYTLLLYGSIEEVRQLAKYIQSKSTLYVLIAHRQRKCMQKRSSNVQVMVIEQFTERIIREHIDRIIEREELQLKKGRVMKPKKAIPAAILYDQTIIEHIKQIDLIKSIFPQGKPITISRREFTQLTAQFNICELALYQLGHQHLQQSCQITTIFQLFTIYMNPIHTHSVQLNTQHVCWSNRLLWLKHCKETSKKERLKGKLNDLSINRVHSPRNRSFKNIDLYISQKGITIIHNTITFNKIYKTLGFKSQHELISLIFNQHSKGNHAAVALTQDEYHHMRQLCQMKVSGILWIVTTSNQHLCMVRQPTLIFCLPSQLQSVVLGVTEHFRIAKLKQFQMQQSVDLVNISKESNRVVVYWYAKWCDYVQQRQAQYIAQTINLVKYSAMEQIQIIDMKYAIFSDENTLNLTMLHNNNTQTPSTLQKQLDEESPQMVFILLHSKLTQLIKQALQMIAQTNYTLITYNEIEQLLLYAQPTKTLIIMQANQQIRIGTCLCIQEGETAFDIKYKLAAHIQSVRTFT